MAQHLCARQQLANHVVHSLRQRGTAEIFLDDIAAHPEPLSAQQLLYRARRIVACWLAGGCRPGDSVLLFGELSVDAVCILVAGLVGGVRVAVLEHTADLRELRHALHDSRPTFVHVTSRTAPVAAQLDPKAHPQLRRILVIGDEFLGRTALASFNVFVRNARVPDVAEESEVKASPSSAFDGGSSDSSVALLLFSCDAIGRFRFDRLDAGQMLAETRQTSDGLDRPKLEALMRFGQTGEEGLMSKSAVERLVFHVLVSGICRNDDECVRCKL